MAADTSQPKDPPGFYRPYVGAALEPIPEPGAPRGMPPISREELPSVRAGQVPPGWNRPATAQEAAWAAANQAN
jgi:hypothetical protein